MISVYMTTKIIDEGQSSTGWQNYTPDGKS